MKTTKHKNGDVSIRFTPEDQEMLLQTVEFAHVGERVWKKSLYDEPDDYEKMGGE